MIINKKAVCLALFLLFLPLVTVQGAMGGDGKEFPVIYAPETTFTHPSVIEGDAIVHDYIIQNRGTAELKIEEVRTD